MLNILITGIAGQLGNRLSELLKDRNIEHRGIGRCPDYKTDVPYLCKVLLEIDNKELKEFIKPVTHIIHFADVINDSRNFEEDLETLIVVDPKNSNSVLFSFKFTILAEMKFIFGEPMNPPTNKLEGLLYNSKGDPV